MLVNDWDLRFYFGKDESVNILQSIPSAAVFFCATGVVDSEESKLS